jgi:hypothetical protein
MPGKTPFRLNRSGLLLALISTAFAGQAQAAAGRVEFAIGPAMVVGADGRTRPAARGTEVDAGDTVRTQQNARVQVRMADGAYISLQPNTEFGIKDYKFEGKTDGSENAEKREWYADTDRWNYTIAEWERLLGGIRVCRGL